MVFEKNDLTLEHHSLIQNAVTQGIGANDWRIADRMQKGCTGASVYKLSINEVFYVLKIADMNDGPPANSMLIEAAQRGLSPQVYFTSATGDVCLMQYIDAKLPVPITMESLYSIAGLIRNVHQCQIFPKSLSSYEFLQDTYLKLPQKQKKSLFIHQCMTEAARIQKSIFDEQDIRACHGDINTNNLLFDGCKYYLIDWQAAKPESYYFDLASCANHFYFYSDLLCHELLKAYFNREPEQHERYKFSEMRKFCYIYTGIVSIFLASQMEELPSLSEQEINELPDYIEYSLSILKKYHAYSAKELHCFGYILLKTSGV